MFHFFYMVSRIRNNAEVRRKKLSWICLLLWVYCECVRGLLVKMLR